MFFINSCRAASFGSKTGLGVILAPFGKGDGFLGKGDKSSGCFEQRRVAASSVFNSDFGLSIPPASGERFRGQSVCARESPSVDE